MTFVAPQDKAAEQAVLGAVMVDNRLMDAVAALLAPDDFYAPVHRWIYQAALDLHLRQEPVDFLTLKAALQTAGRLDEVGQGYLAGLPDGMPHGANAEAYAKIVREKALRRTLIETSQDAIRAAASADDEADVLLDQAQQALSLIASTRKGGFVPICDIVQGEVMPLIERYVTEKRAVTGVPTGLIDFDAVTRGFQPADLIIIAARPSMGKTALVLNAAVHAATIAQAHVGFFSLEMSRLQLALRAVVGEARVDGMRLQSGRVYEQEWAPLSHAYGKVANSLLHIDDTADITIHDIRARARRLKAQVGLDMVVVDYLQLMGAAQRGENRNLEVAAISRGLKILAKDLAIPVVVLSQLSRSCEARADKRPTLADLRDSGAIEQDADLVVFIYRDEVYDKETQDRGIAELSIAKHRNGPIGVVRVGFERSQTRFYNLDTVHEGAV